MVAGAVDKAHRLCPLEKMGGGGRWRFGGRLGIRGGLQSRSAAARWAGQGGNETEGLTTLYHPVQVGSQGAVQVVTL